MSKPTPSLLLLMKRPPMTSRSQHRSIASPTHAYPCFSLMFISWTFIFYSWSSTSSFLSLLDIYAFTFPSFHTDDKSKAIPITSDMTKHKIQVQKKVKATIKERPRSTSIRRPPTHDVPPNPCHTASSKGSGLPHMPSSPGEPNSEASLSRPPKRCARSPFDELASPPRSRQAGEAAA